MNYHDLEIRIGQQQAGHYPVELILDNAQEFGPGRLDSDQQPSLAGSPAEVGQRLFDWLLADDDLKFTMNVDGSDQRQLTRDFATEPSYSAAAGQIVYSKPQLGGIVSLFSIHPDGSGERGIDTQVWDNWEPAIPANNSQLIAFTSSRKNLNWEIWLSRFPGVDETPKPVTCEPTAPAEFPELLKWAPAWSRDGTKIAFVVSTGKDEYAGEANIWVMDKDRYI